MDVKSRVIFLDVDGPLIPSGMYLINPRCSLDRKCSPIAIATVNQMCRKSGARLVMNSTHNDYKDLRGDLIREGISEQYFHEDWRTAFPAFGHFSDFGSRNARYGAIKHWLKQHPEIEDWACFDDEKFCKKSNLIVVDFDQGLHPGYADILYRRWDVITLTGEVISCLP